MRSYMVKLPRNLEVDIFHLPEDFDEQVKRVFGEYTRETSKAYRDCDRLGFIDCCVRHLNGDIDPDDAVNNMVEDYMLHEWRNEGALLEKEDLYCFDFMEDCYKKGIKNAEVCSHFGSDDHHIYDEIQRVLVRVIRIVMNYEEDQE